MQISDGTADFIIIICKNYALCLTKDAIFKCDVMEFNLNAIYFAIKSVIFNAEKRLNQFLNNGILLIDFETLKEVKMKVLKENSTDIEKIKFDIEEKLNRKVISLVFLKSDGEYQSIKAFTSQKTVSKKIVDLANAEGIEILEAQALIEFIYGYISTHSNVEGCNFIKFDRDYCELSFVKNGKVCFYEVNSEFGLNTILNNLSAKFHLPVKDLKTLIENYRVISNVERMAKYKEREEFDFPLRDLIESTKFIYSLHFEIKHQIQNLKMEFGRLFPLSINQKYYFFYEPEFCNLNLHDFASGRNEGISVNDLSSYIFNIKKTESSMLQSFYNQVKKIFLLNS